MSESKAKQRFVIYNTKHASVSLHETGSLPLGVQSWASEEFKFQFGIKCKSLCHFVFLFFLFETYKATFPWYFHLVLYSQKLSEIKFDYHGKMLGEFNLYVCFVPVKVLTLSLRVAVTWCCLDSSSFLLPLESCLCNNPSILFTAPLHPYRANDHGSGQLLNAVVSSVLLSDSSSIALDGTQMYLLNTSPPHLTDRVMWF